MALTAAEWTGKNREDIRDFANLLDLIFYAAAIDGTRGGTEGSESLEEGVYDCT